MHPKGDIGWLAAVLGLGLGIRVVNLTGLLTAEHTWRQADTAAIARNFAQEEFNLLVPRVDWRGDTPGYVESEFPLYPFAVAALYRRVGVHLAWARLVSVGCSMAALVGVYLLTAALADRRAGIWAAGLAAISPMQSWLGQAVMPEALLLACLVWAVWLYVRHIQDPAPMRILGAGLLMGLAVSIKPMMLYVGLPLAFAGFDRFRWRALGRLDMWVFLGLATLPAMGWYWHARRLGRLTGLTFGIWEAGEGKWGNWDLTFSGEFWSRILTAHLADTYLLWAGIPLVLWGAWQSRRARIGVFCGSWILGGLICAALVARGCYLHNYYLHTMIVPLMMLAAVPCAACFSDRIGTPRFREAGTWLVILCILFMSGYGAMRYRRFMFRKDAEAVGFHRLAEKAAPLIPPEVLIVAVDDHSPLLMYQLNRKGWHCGAVQCTPAFLNAVRARGAQYLVGHHRSFAESSRSDWLKDFLASPSREVPLDDGQDFVGRL